MRLITERSLILDVAKNWDATYRGAGWGDKKETGRRLHALDLQTATAGEVAAIIGNWSWTRLYCNECGVESKAVIEVGEPPYYESATAYLCFPCIRQLSAIMEAASCDTSA